MSEATSSKSSGIWFASAVVSSIAGGAATVGFLIWWFVYVSGHCGVVRFYEQAMGAIFLCCWLAGTGCGLLIARAGRRRAGRTIVTGSLVAILVNLIALAVCFAWIVSLP